MASLFFFLHSFILLALLMHCRQHADVLLVIKLSPKFAHPSIEAGRGKEGRRGGEREEPNYFSRFHCQVINKTQLSSPDAQPGASLRHIYHKIFGIFFFSGNNSRFLSWLDIKKVAGGKITAHARDIHGVMEKNPTKCASWCLFPCASLHTCVFQLDKCARITLAPAS